MVSVEMESTISSSTNLSLRNSRAFAWLGYSMRGVQFWWDLLIFRGSHRRRRWVSRTLQMGWLRVGHCASMLGFWLLLLWRGRVGCIWWFVVYGERGWLRCRRRRWWCRGFRFCRVHVLLFLLGQRGGLWGVFRRICCSFSGYFWSLKGFRLQNHWLDNSFFLGV